MELIVVSIIYLFVPILFYEVRQKRFKPLKRMLFKLSLFLRISLLAQKILNKQILLNFSNFLPHISLV